MDASPANAYAFAHGSHITERHHAGARAHRSVLHRDEYVSPEAVDAIEAAFGFTRDDVRRCLMSGGRITPALLPTRAAIDARIAELVDAGGNMSAFRRVFGIPSRRVIQRAVRRASRN